MSRNADHTACHGAGRRSWHAGASRPPEFMAKPFVIADLINTSPRWLRANLKPHPATPALIPLIFTCSRGLEQSRLRRDLLQHLDKPTLRGVGHHEGSCPLLPDPQSGSNGAPSMVMSVQP